MQGMIQNFVRSTLSLTFVIAAARVVFNIKARMARETSWQLELKGDLTKQRRVEAVDKLLSVMTLLVSLVFGLQAIGLDGEPLISINFGPLATLSLWPSIVLGDPQPTYALHSEPSVLKTLSHKHDAKAKHNIFITCFHSKWTCTQVAHRLHRRHHCPTFPCDTIRAYNLCLMKICRKLC